MARPNSGPRLTRLKKQSWKRAIYYIRWTENGRSRERSTGEVDLHRAEEVFAEWLLEKGQRTGPGGRPRRLSEMTIADALNDYALEHAPETANPERISYAMDALLQWWQDGTVSLIRTETCKRYHRERDAADATVRRELGTLRAAVRHAVRAGRLIAAPDFWMPPPPAPKNRWLAREEAAALLREVRASPKMRPYMQLFILIALYTGQRKEAILSLRWTQVDLVRERIDFNQPGRKQTKKRRPVIPIPPRLARFLRLAQAQAHCPYVVHRNGRRLDDIKKGFKVACLRAGLNDVTPHTLRHTAGTWLAQAGVDLWQISGYLGHDYTRTTELYAHHHPEFLKGAAEAFN